MERESRRSVTGWRSIAASTAKVSRMVCGVSIKRRPDPHLPPLIEQQHTVRMGGGERQIVQRDHRGRQRFKQGEHFELMPDVEMVRRLVRISRSGFCTSAGRSSPAASPRGKRGEEARAPSARGPSPPAHQAPRGRGLRQRIMRRQPHLHHLGHAEAKSLTGICNTVAILRATRGRQRPDIAAVDFHHAGAGPMEAVEAAQKAGFARAIGADDGQHLAGGDLQIRCSR